MIKLLMKKMRDDKLVSIIVPVYNVENYIDRCISSLLGQTYKNIEIVLVNDGSIDASLQLIRKYIDPRIVLIDKKNGGLSSARNLGIKFATGSYIIYVDGDDYLDQHTIEFLMKEVDKDTDVVLFPYIKDFSNKSLYAPLFDKDKLFLDKQSVYQNILAKLIGPSKVLGLNGPDTMDRLNTAWGKLYRREVIGDIQFADTKEIGPEDCWFNICVFFNCKKVKYITSTRYHYNKTNSSSLLHKYDMNLIEKRWTMYRYIFTFLEEQKLEDFKKNLLNRIYMERFMLLKNIWFSNAIWKTKYRLSDSLLNDQRYIKVIRKFKTHNLPLKWRLFYWLCDKKVSIVIGVLFSLYGIIKE